MNLVDAGIECTLQIARDDCHGNDIDEHCQAVLPDTQKIIENEVILTLYQRHINDLMKQEAAKTARTLATRKICHLADATLVVHCLVRGMWLGISYDRKFQDFVSSNVSGTIHTVRGTMRKPDPILWRRSPYLWLPVSVGTDRQIFLTLVEQYKQYRFIQQCWAELTRRHSPSNDIEKYTFALLTDSGEFRQHRKEAIQWLRNESKRIAPDVGEDAMADCLEKLLGRPLHMQIQKIGATRKAIRDRANDIRRKGGKHEHVSFEEKEEIAATIADESLSTPDSKIMDDEFPQILSINQLKIEEILSRGSPKRRRSTIGNRRFKVMQMLASDPHLTSVEIARQLDTSPQTIGLDRGAIKDKWSLLKKVIDSA